MYLNRKACYGSNFNKTNEIHEYLEEILALFLRIKKYIFFSSTHVTAYTVSYEIAKYILLAIVHTMYW